MPRKLLVLLPFLTSFLACATGLQTVPDAWMTPVPSRQIGAVEFASDGSIVSAGPRRTDVPPVRVVRTEAGATLYAGELALTPAFVDIESFDVSTGRREVVFSAKRETNFDVGLVALEGSRVSWVPEDSADEVNVSYAPRGNKISYFVRGGGGDIVRTVHIPTSVALAVDFPFSVLRALVWEAPAERFAVTVESLSASPHVEVMRYGGEDRRVAIAPQVRLNVEPVPIGEGAVLLQPEGIQYSERLPLVIWVTAGPLNAWNDARGELLSNVRAACVVTTKAPDDALFASLAAMTWIDATRTFVVDASAQPVAQAKHLTILGDAAVANGRYRRDGNLIRVQPAVVESFAAGFITQQLKGTLLRGR